MTTPQDRLRSRRWRCFSSAWLLTPVLSLGLLTSFAFLWVGLRLRSRGVLLASAGYLAVTVFFLATSTTAPQPPDRPVDDVALLLALVAWIGGSIHAFHVNRRYLVLKAEEAAHGWSPAPVGPAAPVPAEGDAARRLGLSADQQGLWGGSPARQPQATAAPAAAPLDLNAATTDELEAVPGVDASLAARIVAERTARGGFGSVEQLSALVPPHVLVRLAPHLVVPPPAAAPVRRPGARIVDV